MIVTDFADLLGARGPRVRWERVLLFMLAWLLSDVAYQLVLPLGAAAWQGTPSFLLVSATTALQVAASFVRIALVSLLAVALLRRVPSVSVVIVVLALVHAPLSRFLFMATLALRGIQVSSSLWDPLGLGLQALGALCFFGGLALGLRFIPRLVPALLAGAVGGQLATVVLHTATLVATQRLQDVGASLRAAPLTALRCVVFALLLGGALLSVSARPTAAPGDREPDGA